VRDRDFNALLYATLSSGHMRSQLRRGLFETPNLELITFSASVHSFLRICEHAKMRANGVSTGGLNRKRNCTCAGFRWSNLENDQNGAILHRGL
jgi:hypothetical protein